MLLELPINDFEIFLNIMPLPALAAGPEDGGNNKNEIIRAARAFPVPAVCCTSLQFRLV